MHFFPQKPQENREEEAVSYIQVGVRTLTIDATGMSGLQGFLLL